MINDKLKIRARNSWLKGSEELKFEIISPFKIFIEGKEIFLFAYLPQYGSKKGMVLELTEAPDFITDTNVIKWAKENQYHYSFINVHSYLNYDKDLFIDTLNDWGRLGNSSV